VQLLLVRSAWQEAGRLGGLNSGGGHRRAHYAKISKSPSKEERASRGRRKSLDVLISKGSWREDFWESSGIGGGQGVLGKDFMGGGRA